MNAIVLNANVGNAHLLAFTDFPLEVVTHTYITEPGVNMV